MSSVERETKRLKEVTADANKHPSRYTEWEQGFLRTCTRMVTYGLSTLDFSKPQAKAFDRIEKKTYS